MRIATALGWAILITLLGIGAAHAEKRVALVIGNGAYQHADKLANTLIDARRMRERLAGLGFDVVYGENVGKQALERTIGAFASAAQDADVALVYFAGHGATFGDVPYVVPVDARFSSLAGMPYELVPVETLIGELRRAKGLRIAILDACRDNTAERTLKRVAVRGSEVTRGLARVANPDGLILAYATQYMATAADGPANQDSPFTAALLDHIGTPGLDVKELFFRVGSQVIANTRGAQRPEISVSFYDSYTLVPARPAPAPTNAPSPNDVAAQAWAATKDTRSQSILEEFIRQFGTTPYGAMARARLEELKKSQVAAAAPPVAPVVPPGPCGEGAMVASVAGRLNCPLSSAQEASLKPKDSFRECDKCPEMVVVPAGSFMMGSPRAEDGHTKDEEPQHPVAFARQFAAGRFAVTFEEWDACVADGGCNGYRPWDNGWGRVRRPVINVSWQDARSYAAWLSRKTGKTYRLLSEAEREYLTRAGTTAAFWWGNAISPRQARYTVEAAGNKKSPQQTTPVDAYDPNPWGFYQSARERLGMGRRLCEPDYKGAPSDGAAWTTGTCTQRVLRGGSWVSASALLRSASRYGVSADGRVSNVGFRVARSIGQ